MIDENPETFIKKVNLAFCEWYKGKQHLASALIICAMGLLLMCTRSVTETSAEQIPTTFAQLCATCHGADLKGHIAQSLLDGSWQFGARPTDIFRAIKFGHPQAGMPSWKMVLTDSEIDSLVSYLLREETRQGLSKPAIPKTLETQDYQLDVQVVADDLRSPWGIAFMDDQRILITEQRGRLRVVEHGALVEAPVSGLNEVVGGGQGGLMDVVVDPNFEDNNWVYLSIRHRLGKQQTDRRREDKAPAMTKIIRGKLIDYRWTEEQVLFEAPHESYLPAGAHFGGRMIIDTAGFLFFSVGDRDSIEHAQDLTRPNGKIHRIYTDGSIPTSNPFYGQEGIIASIYSYGNRNAQGLAFHPETDELWSTEHGPMGGDELNVIELGANYGWPVISHGINYNGELITELTHLDGMMQPICYWKPSIATCGLDFYHGDLFPKWENRLLVGSLKQEELQLLHIEKHRVIYNETILKNAGRIREVKTGPDGAIYVLLNRPGTLLRLSPGVGQWNQGLKKEKVSGPS